MAHKFTFPIVREIIPPTTARISGCSSEPERDATNTLRSSGGGTPRGEPPAAAEAPSRGTSATPTPAAASEQATLKSPVSATILGSNPAARHARRTSSPHEGENGGAIQSAA